MPRERFAETGHSHFKVAGPVRQNRHSVFGVFVVYRRFDGVSGRRNGRYLKRNLKDIFIYPLVEYTPNHPVRMTSYVPILFPETEIKSCENNGNRCRGGFVVVFVTVFQVYFVRPAFYCQRTVAQEYLFSGFSFN